MPHNLCYVQKLFFKVVLKVKEGLEELQRRHTGLVGRRVDTSNAQCIHVGNITANPLMHTMKMLIEIGVKT